MMQRVDWFMVLADLQRFGFSNVSVAHQVDVPRSSLATYKEGSEPSHAVGEKLIAFWCACTARTRDELPMTQRFERRSR